MSLPKYPAGKPSQKWTFEELVNWANQVMQPGAGDQFIAWVRANNNVPAPYVLDVNKNTFGPGGFGANNTAYAWFTTWVAQGVVGPALGEKLREGIKSGTVLIPKALKGAAEGIGQVPGAQLLSSPWGAFANFLTSRSLWIRIAEGVLGGAFILIALTELGGNTKIGHAATKAGKAVKLL